MLETLETRKKQHEMKIKNTKVLQPILWVILIIYFIYFIILDTSFPGCLLLSIITGVILWSIGLIHLKLFYELREKQKIMNIATINEMKKINI